MPPETFLSLPLKGTIVISLSLAIIWGIIFKDMLEFRVADWNVNRDSQTEIDFRRPGTIVAFALTCFFLLPFSTASLIAIGFPLTISAGISIAMVGVAAALIWIQLGTLLQELVRGGSRALDIDILDFEDLPEQS